MMRVSSRAGRGSRMRLSAILAMLFLGISLAATSAVFGEAGVPGASFTGGDGSYKRVVREGIVLGIATDFPYTYVNAQTKKPDGMDVAIFQALTKRLGITKVSYQVMPFDGLIPALLAKRIDVIVDNIHETPARLKVIDFTSPAYWYGPALGVQKGNPKNIHTWADLKGRSVGTVRGSEGQQLLEQRKDLRLKLYTNNEEEFADLAAGRVDVVFEDDIKIYSYLKAHPGFNMEAASGFTAPLTLLGYARYGVRKDDVDLNWAISRALDEMRGDETVSKIITQYGLTPRNLWYFPE